MSSSATPTAAEAAGTRDTQAVASERKTLSLPWLEVDGLFEDTLVREQVERGLYKLTTSLEGGGAPPLEASFFLSDDPDDLREAHVIWDDPTLRYQFVQGVSSGAEARFATEDGSVLRLNFAERRLSAALRTSTFAAPHSTWGDVLLAPLTEHWREHGFFPLHAGAVELEEQQFLVSGHSGSGKTTLCLACLTAGGSWRADDKVLFRVGDGELSAISLYRNTNLHPETIPHFAGLAFTLDRPPIDETNAKRPCLLEELPVRCDLSSFTPTALLFPKVRDCDNTEVVRLPPAAALLRLAAQSPLSSHPPRMAAQVRATTSLVRRLPAFEVRSGRDVLLSPEIAAARLLRAVREGSKG